MEAEENIVKSIKIFISCNECPCRKETCQGLTQNIKLSCINISDKFFVQNSGQVGAAMRDVMKAGVSAKLREISKCKKKKKISFQTFYPDVFNVTLSGDINKEAVEEQVINLNGNKFNIKFLSMVDKHTYLQV